MASTTAADVAAATAARLLNFEGSGLDIALLDATVNAFYGAGSSEEVCCCWAAAAAREPRIAAATTDIVVAAQRITAEAVLKRVQEHPDAWTRVDAILEQSTNPQAKFFGLQARKPRCCLPTPGDATHPPGPQRRKRTPATCSRIPKRPPALRPQVLEAVVRTRWGALPDAQREGIKTYISNLIIKTSTDEATFRRERTFLSKLNLVLVDVLKQDWPHKWPSFIPDIVGASKTNVTLCENSMAILRLLSEEVFDFSRNDLTQVRCNEARVLHSAAGCPCEPRLPPWAGRSAGRPACAGAGAGGQGSRLRATPHVPHPPPPHPTAVRRPRPRSSRPASTSSLGRCTSSA
jgi:exportin-1